jgi:uncharacterized protein YkwD
MMTFTPLQSPTSNARWSGATLLAISLATLTACGGGTNTPDATVSEQAAQAADAPAQLEKHQAPTQNWNMLIGEGQAFNVPANTTVRYGRADVGWVDKKVSGEGQCSNDFFGFDPKPAGYRHCYVAVRVNPVPAPVPLPSTPPATPAPLPVPPVDANADAPKATCGLQGFAVEALAEMNRFRASAQSCGEAGNFSAAGPLRWSAGLNQFSSGYSQIMVGVSNSGKSDGLSHDLPGEGDFSQRSGNAKYYQGFISGENIAYGYSSVGTVMKGWEDSSGHCANIMSKSANEVGLACVTNNQGTPYWTMVLGTKK